MSGLPLDKIAIAQSLKKAGYATAMFGKWDLGEDAAHHPAARGFDEAIASMGVHFEFKTNPKTEYLRGKKKGKTAPNRENNDGDGASIIFG